LIGIAANLTGMIFYIALFSEMNFNQTLTDAIEKDYLGKLIALGAILNFLPFFLFLKKNQPYHARGILLASLLAAIVIAISKFV